MKLITNQGQDRLFDRRQTQLHRGAPLDLTVARFSLFAFAELAPALARLDRARIILPANADQLGLLGTTQDRPRRNRLRTR